MSGDFLGDLLGGHGIPRPSKATAEKPEKGVQLRGRDIDGTFYVRVDDVVALLESNGVLPKATRLLKGRVKP